MLNTHSINTYRITVIINLYNILPKLISLLDEITNWMKQFMYICNLHLYYGFYLWEKETFIEKLKKKRSTLMCRYSRYFLKNNKKKREKKAELLLNSVLICNCHSSSLQLSPTIFLAPTGFRGTELRRIESRDCFQLRSHCGKKDTRRAFGPIFWSPRHVGELLDFRDHCHSVFLHRRFFREIRVSSFFPSRVHRNFSLFERQR